MVSVKDWSPRKGPPRYKGRDVVIFRKWSEGDIIALFPEHPADDEGLLCDSYQHVGQHGGANCVMVINATRPANHEEYARLAEELTRIGYDLNVQRRLTRPMTRRRVQAAVESR